jgi:predicted HTH domain antitoxin
MQEIQHEAQQGVVIWEYLNGHLSLRQCSDLLRIGYRSFLELLWSRGIPVDGLSQEEVRQQADYLCQRLGGG